MEGVTIRKRGERGRNDINLSSFLPSLSFFAFLLLFHFSLSPFLFIFHITLIFCFFDRQALRGSRQPNYRTAKNVVRYIRYRLAVRSLQVGEEEQGETLDPGYSYKNGHDNNTEKLCLNGGDEESNKCKSQLQGQRQGQIIDTEIESDLRYNKDDRLYQLALRKKKPSSSFSFSSFSSSSSTLSTTQSQSQSQSQLQSQSQRSTDDSINKSIKDDDEVAVYSSESEMISALTSASMDPLYSEIYQRCCKVLIKIANLNQAKHFFWEVDSVMYPDYYSSINRPMMIANVTSSLIRQLYGNNDIIVGNLFYNDLRQITLNCFAFNTEVTAINAPAQKLYQV